MEKSLERGQDGSVARRTRIGDIRRDELTAAALRCIAAKGYDLVTLEDVAREAGSSQGNVLYYFKNRDALMMSTAKRIGEDMMEHTRAIWGMPATVQGEKMVREWIRRRCSEPTLDLMAVIRSGVGLLIDWFEESVHLMAVALELFCQVRRNPVIAEVRDRVHPYIRNASAAFIEQGILRGVFKDRDPEVAAHVLLTLIAGFALAQVTTRKGQVDPDLLEKELCELIFGYLEEGSINR
jgi:AcrR family transcriptional regulator